MLGVLSFSFITLLWERQAEYGMYFVSFAKWHYDWMRVMRKEV